MEQNRKLRWNVRPGTRKETTDRGTLKSRSFGIRVGYWPCLYAPFIQIAFNTMWYEVWFGLPSYKGAA